MMQPPPCTADAGSGPIDNHPRKPSSRGAAGAGVWARTMAWWTLAALALAAQVAAVPAGFNFQFNPLLDQNDAESGRDAEDSCDPITPFAIPLEHNVTLWGELRPPEDIRDYYRIQAQAGQILNLTMMPAPDLPPEIPVPDYDLRLHGPACQVVASSESILREKANIKFLVVQPGTYSVQVCFPQFCETPGGSGAASQRAAAPVATTRDCHPPCGEYGYLLHEGNLTLI